MKVNTRNKIILIILGCIVSIPLWIHFNYIPLKADTCFHTNRFLGALEAFKSGQFIPQLNPKGMMGMGTANTIFYGPFESIMAALGLAITNSLYIVSNSLFTICVITAGLSMYFTSKEIFKTERKRLVSAVIYLVSPILIWCLIENGDHGMALGIALFPLVFCGVYRILHNRKRGFTILAIAGTIILTSHLLTAFLAVLFSFIYIVLEIKKMTLKKWLKLISCAVLIFCLSAYYILPLLKARSLNLYSIFVDPSNIMSINGTFMNQWRLFDFSANGGLAIMKLMGMYWILIIFLMFVLLIKPYIDSKKQKDLKIDTKNDFLKKSAQNRICKQFFVITVITFLLMTPLVNWNISSLLSIFYNFQFPWRFGVITEFCSAIVLAIGFDYLYNYLKPILVKLFSFCLLFAIVVLEFYVTTARSDNKLLYVGAQRNSEIVQISGAAEYLPNNLPSYLKTSKLLADKMTCTPLSQDDLSEDVGNGNLVTQTDIANTNKQLSVNIISGDIQTLNVNDFVDNKTVKVKAGSSGGTIEVPLNYFDGYSAYLNSGVNSSSDSDGKLDIEPSQNGMIQIRVPANYDGLITVKWGMSFWSILGVCVTVFSAILSLIIFIKIRISNKSKFADRKPL
ncbi:MAG: hypothetical protein LBM13_05540 [Candidatus Ancillula sp.]|jgi:hypothetical protein|nr:hypothetical protein [Candidatus Ancillula sp.]